MDSKHVIGLYEAYLDVYEGDDLYEANKAEKEMNLTPKQRSRLRNVSYKQEYTTPSQRRNVYSNASNLGDSDKAGLLHPHDRGDQRSTQKWHKQIATKRKEEHQNKQRNEDLDIYDLVLDHLLDEGYCDDVESAEVIMANMSEEWVYEIVEAVEIMSVTSPEGKLRKGTRIRPPQTEHTRTYRRLAALQKRQRENPKAISTRSAREQSAREVEKNTKKSLKNLNADPNVEVKHGYVDIDNDGYRSVSTDYRARRRRASGR